MTQPQMLELDPIACDGRGLCVELLPEMIRLDEWGYPIVDPRRVPPSLIDHARRAVAACPVLALRLRTMGPARSAHRAGRPPAAER